MRYTFMVLVVIAVVGLLGIPLGDPRFLYTAIILECVYIVLAVLALKTVMGKGKKKNKKGMAMMVTIPSITIASIVIVANTLSTTHLRIMVSLTPLYNALILIVGGYVLQILLIISSLYEYREMMRLADLNAK
ncbi:MAG: hypothetical protein QW572_00995 [Candidatus Nitrosocaldus sp.]